MNKVQKFITNIHTKYLHHANGLTMRAYSIYFLQNLRMKF